jgi:hypothetical protein
MSMANSEWIICERSTRWVAALRTYFRRTPSGLMPFRIFETRRMRDVYLRLRSHSACVVLLEVDRETLPSVLEWLAENAQRYPIARFAALLDRSLMDAAAQREEIFEVLLEAGACEVASSPRQLRSIVNLARHHVNSLAAATAPDAAKPLVEWARDHLPWQADGRRVG